MCAVKKANVAIAAFLLITAFFSWTNLWAEGEAERIDAVSIEPGPLPPVELAQQGESIFEVQDKVPLDGSVSFSLKNCIDLALERSRKLRAAGYDIEAAKGQLSEAKALLWPVLEYQYRIAPVPKDVDNALNDFFSGQVTLFNSINILIAMPVMTFGKIPTAKRMAEGGVEAARINEAKARETTVYQVKQLYYGVQMAKEMIHLLDDAVEKIDNKLADEEAKEIKDIEPYDIMQLKLTKVDLERRAQEARQNLELANEGLRIQLDLEPGTPVELESENLKPVPIALNEEKSFVDTAVELQPEAKLLDIGVNTKRLQYKMEKLKLLPNAGFGFYFDLGRTTGFVANVVDTGAYNDPFNYTRAGIGLQFKGNLDFHGSYGRIKKARAEYYKAALEGVVGRRALRLDIKKAHLSASRARDDVIRARKAQSIARQMVFTTKINNDMGLGDNQKYGDALKAYLLMRGLYFKAIYDYNMSVADLSQRVGNAKAEEMMPQMQLEEYEIFDETTDDEGFETYGVADTAGDREMKTEVKTEGEGDATNLDLGE